MARLRRLRAISRWLAKALLALIVVILIVILTALGVVETGWAKNRLRELIVRQANQYLTATLQIGRLEGSLLGGVRLGDINLTRAGRTLIHIDEVSLEYSVRELVQSGVVIQSVRLTHPVVVGSKQPDGRWDLGALVKRESREQERTGPSRPIEIRAIDVVDGRISLRDPLEFGAAHVPTEFDALNASMKFAYYPVRWKLTFNRVSWTGRAPDLTVTRLAGAMGHGPGGWFFEDLSVDTPRSAFVLAGSIHNDRKPTELDLQARAGRFAFQEWSGVLRGLKNIAVEASFDTSLKGPVNRLATVLRLSGTGGSVKGRLTLDTSVPGWHGAGAVDVGRLDLARWLNRRDRPSDITGHVTFDLALELGRHFPRGVYTFDGPHAMYMDYEADDVRARGQITATTVLIAQAAASAYGADVSTTDGSIGIDEPFPFRFQGRAAHLDLRRLPKTIPVPHVESALALDYDVTGRFSRPFINGHATFARSEFLGAIVGAGTIGSIDTSQSPLCFTGDGEVQGLNLHRLGQGLEVAWLQEPRYAGTVSGRFRVEGAGTTAATLALAGGGRVARADLFKGALADADVSIDIDHGTLRASYDGTFSTIDPAIPFADPRLAASLTGFGRVSATVNELLLRETTLEDYDVRGALTFRSSMVRDLLVDRAFAEATLADSTLTVTRLEAAGPELEGHASGTVGFSGDAVSDFTYDFTRVDLARVQAQTGRQMAGALSTKGRLTGPFTALRAAGDATVNQLDAFDVNALTVDGRYDATVPSGDFARATIRVDGHASFLMVAGQSVQQASGTITFDAQRLGFDVTLQQKQGRSGALRGAVLLNTERRDASLLDLAVTLGRAPWRLARQPTPPALAWSDVGFTVAPIEFVEEGGEGRIGVSGTWRTDGAGALGVTARRVFLDNLQSAFEQPARYGGIIDADATISGTRDAPRVSATLAVSNGRVERVSYQKLAGRFEYTNRRFDVDLRLDQAPGIWITAVGTAPLSLFNPEGPEEPIDLAIKSSGINLGLIEGVTDVIRGVTGDLQLDVRAIGTTRDPHFAGSVAVANAAFTVVGTGSKYKNASLGLTLSPDRITVDALHVEDANGRPLDLHGSLATHELRVGDLEIEMLARRFEVMRNELGRVEVDATLHVKGRSETPRVTGDLTISSGDLKVDQILERTLFQPYATEEARPTEVDAVAALNPWQRLGLDVALHVPNTLKLTGENVQISTGTPIGLGDINLRVAGDLYLYKDPAQPMSVNGSFDQVTGTYVFQGRRFDVDPASSINFRGDLDPEIYVTVTRVISGVQTRVAIAGRLHQPELHLASTPPLDASDILSLIVFNTSTNQLSGIQQQELMVRAGALAAGFIATPIVSAIENEIGIDILELEPGGDFGTGFKLTVGDEILPGLVARFSRQFGQEPYDEATIEYALSRILRLRATFSDAQSLNARSPFRRTERAGIDLLFFFSF